MPPRVSVVIPTYNAPVLLLETLGTVLAQTFADFEVVIINDGSTDDTAEQLKAVTDPRVRVITQPNGGIGAARNRGIDESRGEFIALLDHDDLWLPEKLQAQVDFLDAHPECPSCTVRWAYSPAPDQMVYTPPADSLVHIKRPFAQLAAGWVFLISASIMARKSALAGLRYFTRPKCIEDTPLQIRLLSRGPMGLAGDSILMVYRWHANNYSSQADFFANGILLLRELDADNYFADCPKDEQADLDHFLAHLGRTATMRLIQAKRKKDVWRLYRREFRKQLSDGAVKYLLATPLLVAAPQFLLSRAGVTPKG
ncbi:MAG: glycosyltransferase family 2 protein [Tepidisphaeraceae bacterium]